MNTKPWSAAILAAGAAACILGAGACSKPKGDADLDVAFDIINIGDEMLPASLGGHPAFNWPLVPGLPKEAYTLAFGKTEPAPIRRLKDGLMRPQPEPNPVKGRTLALSEELFDDNAMIFDQVASTSVLFTPTLGPAAATQGPAIEISWRGFRELGIWSKVGGAPFLCIEPWHGFASPAEFDGEFADKPGLMHIAPGARQSLGYRIPALADVWEHDGTWTNRTPASGNPTPVYRPGLAWDATSENTLLFGGCWRDVPR